jgi:hypothetical protein
MNKDFTRNKLIECPEPGILFTRDNAIWAYRALKAARENGQSVPEQDELCGELAGILFPDWATTDREKILARFAPPGPSPRPDNALSPRQVSDEIPGEDSTDDPDDPDPAFDPEAAALLPALGKLMNPARPEGALFYDRDQVAYVVRQVSPEDRQGTWGAVRVLTSFGRLRGWTLGSEHEIRHDQTFRPLGRWVVTGIRNYKTGWQAGEIPDRPLRQWVFK